MAYFCLKTAVIQKQSFAKFTKKHLCQSLLFNKVAGRRATLLKRRLWHRCFPVNFSKFLRTPFLQNNSGRLLLFIAASQGGFIAPHICEIVCRKTLTIFKSCHYSRFYITIFSSFRKIETKDLNSDPRILIFLVLGTNHQLHISYLNIRSDHDTEVTIRGYRFL